MQPFVFLANETVQLLTCATPRIALESLVSFIYMTGFPVTQAPHKTHCVRKDDLELPLVSTTGVLGLCDVYHHTQFIASEISEI